MPELERHGIDNLILLCPNHHRQADSLEPRAWSAERLMEMKLEHEDRCNQRWATEGELEQFASLLVAQAAANSSANDSASTGARGARREAAFIRAINSGTEVIARGGSIVDQLAAPAGFGGRRITPSSEEIDDSIVRLSMAVDEVRMYGPPELVELLTDYFDLAVELREVALQAGDVRSVAQKMYVVKVSAYEALT